MTHISFNSMICKEINMLISLHTVNLINILSSLKKRAIRKCIWHRTLNDEKCVLISISKYIKIVRNQKFVHIVAKMIIKLASRNTFMEKTVIKWLKRLELRSNSSKSYSWNISS